MHFYAEKTFLAMPLALSDASARASFQHFQIFSQGAIFRVVCTQCRRAHFMKTPPNAETMLAPRRPKEREASPGMFSQHRSALNRS